MNRILLVDDEKGIRDLWSENFERVLEKTWRGTCELFFATSEEDAVSMLTLQEFDAIIWDLAMPPGGRQAGIDFIKKNHASLPPIIVMTGSEDIETRQECLSSGAAQFFTKIDASKFPNLFFKTIYNEWWKRTYGPKTSK